MSSISHRPDCTWGQYAKHGETAPGQSFWAGLSYVWCHAKCERPVAEIDFESVYAAGCGIADTPERRAWAALVERAKRKNSMDLARLALDLTSERKAVAGIPVDESKLFSFLKKIGLCKESA